MRRIGKGFAATIAGLVVVGVLAGPGSAFAATTSPSPTPGARGRGAGQPDGVLAGAVHAEGTVTYLGGSTRTLTGDLGRITAVDSSSITILRADGQSVQAPAASGICVRQNGHPAALASLKTGEPALVVQESGAAVVVRAGRIFAGGRRISCGLTDRMVHADMTVLYRDGSSKQFAVDRGMISALPAGQISLLRRDGETVTSSVDDQTIVRLDCRPASLSDLKVGQLAQVFSQNGYAAQIEAFDGLGGM